MPKNDMPNHTPDEKSVPRKGRPTTKVKRRRDPNAPKPPMNGYLRFLVEKRLQKDPSSTSEGETQQDALASIAKEWRMLPEHERQVYTKRAEEERAQYKKQLDAYRKTDSYKQFVMKLEQTRDAKLAGETGVEEANKTDSKFQDPTFGFQIPIFTHVFLEHNKERESELRRLRCEVARLEEEERALNVNVARLKSACDESQAQLATQTRYAQSVEKHTQLFRKSLVNAFANLPLPGQKNGPNSDTIDEYMEKLQHAMMSPSSENHDFLMKVRDLSKKIKLPTV